MKKAMKGIMLNQHVGLETATLNRMKERTARHETICKSIAQDLKLGYANIKYMHDEIYLFTEGENAAVSYKPKYKVGEVVAIKQSYEDIYHSMKSWVGKDEYKKQYDHHAGWTNKMFVKNDLMPHQIKITDIKLEQLQDISDDDCLREGVWQSGNVYYLPSAEKDMSAFDSPRKAFAALVDYACGKGTWKRNDINVVYHYKLIK